MPQKHHDKKLPQKILREFTFIQAKKKINPNASPTMAKEFGFIVFGRGRRTRPFHGLHPRRPLLRNSTRLGLRR